MAPLQGNYSEALPAQVRAKRKVLRISYRELYRSRGRGRSSDGGLWKAFVSSLTAYFVVVCQWRN